FITDQRLNDLDGPISIQTHTDRSINPCHCPTAEQRLKAVLVNLAPDQIGFVVRIHGIRTSQNCALSWQRPTSSLFQTTRNCVALPRLNQKTSSLDCCRVSVEL